MVCMCSTCFAYYDFHTVRNSNHPKNTLVGEQNLAPAGCRERRALSNCRRLRFRFRFRCLLANEGRKEEAMATTAKEEATVKARYVCTRELHVWLLSAMATVRRRTNDACILSHAPVSSNLRPLLVYIHTYITYLCWERVGQDRERMDSRRNEGTNEQASWMPILRRQMRELSFVIIHRQQICCLYCIPDLVYYLE